MARKLTDEQKRAIRQRTSVYMRYWITKDMTAQLAREIPIDLQEARFNAFSYLRRHLFTPVEAYNIVTAKTPKGELQNLDLTLPDWQDRIKAHKLAMEAQAKAVMDITGFTPKESMRIVIRNIDAYYTGQDKDKSFDVFDDYIKNKTKRPAEYDIPAAVKAQIKKYSERIWLSDKRGRPIRLSELQA